MSERRRGERGQNGEIRPFETKASSSRNSKNYDETSEWDFDKENKNFEEERGDRSSKKNSQILKLDSQNKFIISNRNLTSSELKQRYEDIVYKFKSEGEVFCLVCLDEESYKNDDIFLCDLCGAAFHQTCYGSELFDKTDEDEDSEPWYCARCSYLKNYDLPFNSVRCEFCPELKGAIKKIKQKANDGWAHITCVNWIPELYYSDNDRKENVYVADYKKNNHFGRKDMLCQYCNIIYGDCINCDSDSKCETAFHVTCAQFHGVIANWKEMNDLKREDDTEFFVPIYCKEHMKAYNQAAFKFSQIVEKRNLSRKQEISYLYTDPRDSKSKRNGGAYKIPKKVSEPQKRESSSVSKRKPTPEKQIEETKPRRLVKKIDQERKEKSNLNDENLKNSRFFIEPEIEHHLDLVEEINTSTMMIPPIFRAKKRGTFVENPIISQIPALKNPAKKSVTRPEPTVENTAMEIEKENEDKSEKLYKFKSGLANLFKFYDWASQIDIKRNIQQYILKNHLYNKAKEEIEVYKDLDLHNMLGTYVIHRKDFFEKLKPLMYEKDPTVAAQEEKDRAESYENELKKMREEKLLEELKKDMATTTTPTIQKRMDINLKQQKPAFPIRGREFKENHLKKTIEDKKSTKEIPESSNGKRDFKKIADTHTKNGDEDLAVTKKIKPNRPIYHPEKSNDTSSFLSSLLGGGTEEKQTAPKERTEGFDALTHIIKIDHMSFRGKTSWFTINKDLPEFESINSEEVLKALWPKGAEMMF